MQTNADRQAHNNTGAYITYCIARTLSTWASFHYTAHAPVLIPWNDVSATTCYALPLKPPSLLSSLELNESFHKWLDSFSFTADERREQPQKNRLKHAGVCARQNGKKNAPSCVRFWSSSRLYERVSDLDWIHRWYNNIY